MEKDLPPVGRHCRSKRTTKRIPASAKYLASRLPDVKKQQMRWTESGAHRLLQVRTQVLNDDLRATFHRWYPGLKAAPEPAEEEAA
jgi:hypothetical protein